MFSKDLVMRRGQDELASPFKDISHNGAIGLFLHILSGGW
jgi:hypothetical protein